MDKSSKNLIVGLISGVIVGGAAAMLLAPSKGEVTRQKVQDATAQAKHKADELSSKGKQYVESKRSEIEEAVEAGRQAAREKKAELEATVRTQTQT